MNTKLLVSAFKAAAIVEALTWVALLIGMYFKWVQGDVSAVRVPGMTHGIVFIVLVVLTFLVARAQRWDVRTLVLGLVATVVPFCSVVFEVWAQRAGKLDGAAPGGTKTEAANAIGR